MNRFRASGLFSLMLAVGCGPAERPTQTTPGETAANVSTEAGTTATAASGAEKIDPTHITVCSWDQVQEIVQSHQGKIVVLDLWSTYCPPCIKELPGLMKLQAAHSEDVVCLTLNCNFNGLGSPDEEREDILRVLTEVGANCRTLVSGEADESLYKRIGIAAIPVVQVYDRTGKMVKQFDNEKGEYEGEGFTYEQHITPYVDELVRQ